MYSIIGVFARGRRHLGFSSVNGVYLSWKVSAMILRRRRQNPVDGPCVRPSATYNSLKYVFSLLLGAGLGLLLLTLGAGAGAFGRLLAGHDPSL